MTDILKFLNENSVALTVIFSAAVTLATVVYAILTWILVSETRKMRQVQTEPKIEISLQSLDIAVHIFRLHIRNIGLGPALNIKFSPKIVSGGESAKTLITDFTKTNFFKIGLSYLSPGEQRLSHYTEMTNDHNGKISSVIAFDIEYQGPTGKKYKETLTIDMSEHKGTYQLGKPHLYSIALSLEKLQKDLHHVSTGFRRVRADVFNSEDRKAEQQAHRERIENERAK
ncbi:hypothetical protein [Aeromonas salmonicida]|uniref:hypothetical protein n=1 Tax=Aeromonas salmonicida TaxID=645 RepID=UPI0023300A55|nr:hypothetical protein [Aeromonas salmonicida]WCH24690.1 hypothetical protein ONZ54_10315 [Aeromonas salmonicida]